MMFIRMVGAIHSKKLLKTSTDVGSKQERGRGKALPMPVQNTHQTGSTDVQELNN
jgi:hypothetical protein